MGTKADGLRAAMVAEHGAAAIDAMDDYELERFSEALLDVADDEASRKRRRARFLKELTTYAGVADRKGSSLPS